MDLLIDVNVALDVCAQRNPHAEHSAAALGHCLNCGGKLWLYVGSVQTMEYNLYQELMRQTPAESGLSKRQLFYRSRELLQAFCRGKNWLAALAGEGDVLSAGDPEDEQFIRALDRFPPGSCRLLTRDRLLLDNYPEKTISPVLFCRQCEADTQVSFIDLKLQQDSLRPALEKNIHQVMHHGQYIMGPEVRQLEVRLAEFVGVEHCISCASGTDALLMALMVLGIGPGDEVITVPYTWISSAEVIALLRARPVFVDILPDTFNLDPDQLEASITSRTRAIMPVSIYGQCPDMDRINAIAHRHGIPVIEDAAQSFGATYKGRKSCALSQIGCTSFFPSKPLGGYGDGGAIFISDGDLAETLRQIRVHGQKVKHQHPLVGVNGRLDTLQAAILLPKLEIFPQELSHRQAIAQRYTELLAPNSASSESDSLFTTPHLPQWTTSAWAQYTILSEDRDHLSQHLKDAGIPSVSYYTSPLHLQEAFQDLGYQPGDFPVAERVAARCLSLPMSPYLREEDQEKVVNVLKTAVI